MGAPFSGGLWASEVPVGGLWQQGPWQQSGGEVIQVWTPKALFSANEQGAWYTSSKGSDGASISLVLDRSGNGHTLTQDTASMQPNYQQAASGLVIQGDLVDDTLGTPNIPEGNYDLWFNTEHGYCLGHIQGGETMVPVHQMKDTLILDRALTAEELVEVETHFGSTRQMAVFGSANTTIGLQIARDGGGDVMFVGANGVSVTKNFSGWDRIEHDLTVDGLTAPVTVVMLDSIRDSWGISIANNGFEGVFPDLTTNKWMGSFSCTGNRLTGSVPPFSTMPSMAYFECGNNQLSGHFPDLSGHSALVSLNIANNRFKGTFPDVSANVDLESIYAYENVFTGALPDFSANTKLTALSLGDNQFTGNVPDVAALTSLTELNLSANPITGWDGTTFPASLVHLEFGWSNLTSGTVDAMLAALVAAGATDGYAGFQGTSVPSTAGVADKDTLVSRGWTVTVDV